MDDPERADEAVEGAQRVSIDPGARHLDRAENLRRELTLPAAVAV
jgi:hypothetical protein